MANAPQQYPYENEIRSESPGAQIAHRGAFQGILDLNQAVAALAGKASTTATTATAALSSSASSATQNVTNIAVSGGIVNNQTGVTSYITTQGDNGALVVLSAASAVAVTLNFSVTIPWYCSFLNQGAGVVTLTPQQGLIDGVASQTINNGYFSTIFFDGRNFWSCVIPTVPLAFAAIAHDFLTSYNSATGAYTAAQPAIADVSGLSTQLATLAPLASPALTGTPTVPTATAGTNTTQAASTAFTTSAVSTETSRAQTAEGLLAPKASPTFTGTVTQPLPSVITAATTATTATAGAATALPTAPLGYLQMSLNGTTVKIPYYAA